MLLSSSTSTNIDRQIQTLIEHYQKALLIKPNSASLYRKIGNLYQTKNDFEKAREYFQKSIDMNDKFFAPYYCMGLSYKIQGDLEKAIVWCSQAT